MMQIDNKEKQIEEMANAMSDFELKDSRKCDIELAEHLISRGYRKQSDTVKQFVSRISKSVACQTGCFGIADLKYIAKEYGVKWEDINK